MRHSNRFSIYLQLGWCLVTWPHHSLAQESETPSLQQSVSVGAYYAQGDYGEPVDTEILYFPVTYEASVGKWGFQMLVPRLEVTGPGNVLINIGGVTRAVAGTQESTSSGIGDSVASVTYRFDPIGPNTPFVDFRLDVKLPTANEKQGLGTGEFDYSMQLDFSQQFGTAVGFATAGYNFRGKSELYEGLEDSAFAQVGVAYPVNSAINAGIFYDYRESASIYSVETHELVPYVSWQLDARWSLTTLASWGFTDASADTTVLAQLRYAW